MSDEAPLTIKQHKMVQAALPSLEKHATHFERKYRGLVEGDDLRTEGKLALYACVRRYDEARGKSFETFASYRVRGAMVDIVRAETEQARILKEIDRAFYNRMADYHDDFDVLRHDPQELQRRLDVMCQHATAAMFFAGAEQARREEEQDPEAAAEQAESLATLRALKSALEPEEREILDLTFDRGFKLEEVADALGVVKLTAWRRIQRVLESLRREFEAIGEKDMPAPVKLSRPPLCLVPPPPARGKKR